ncbi:M14 family metallocarboxypeptidase [Paenibacillus sp. LHD-117]|uniref:M14 family metallopeptidase n=1 Tax=Paenibacillus sp. LHD-117 TaxID=3071412 RepID=UPI0027E0FB1E|nr:M14 family metallocarboxypeptidase [Paenibacillus sp. LHD-117]MDQ6421828.1 M14 family metallocarboxypeptidase [Paenibacillus sp. LHD-117]
MNDNGFGINVYTYEMMMEQCRQLAIAYPFVAAESIGRSVMGKPILAMRCGCGPRQIHLNASFHANEWITSALLMRFMTELSDCYATGRPMGENDVSRFCFETTVWAVPMVNPDGVELAQRGVLPDHPLYSQLMSWNGGLTDFRGWKANIRGVDLNDQFPAYWEEECKRRGAQGPSPRDYSGPYPLSEPEAQAMARLTEAVPFHAVIALHTQGKEIYWNYRDYEPQEAEELALRLERASGYKSVKLSGSDAGYKDWFIYRYRKPGFTVEAGYGENPLPYNSLDTIYAELRPLLLESLRL